MPLAFLGALALLATRTCASEIANVEIQLVFGATGAATRSVAVEVFRGKDREALAEYKQSFGPDGAAKPVRWKLQLDPGMYTLEFRVIVRGELRQFDKSIKAVNGATITIDVESELMPAHRREE